MTVTVLRQAAYKKPAAGSGGSVMRRSNDDVTAMDWETVKAEDKILVYQVRAAPPSADWDMHMHRALLPPHPYARTLPPV